MRPSRNTNTSKGIPGSSAHAPVRPCAHAAFTLVELLIVMVISSVLFLALATFTHTSLQATDTLQDRNLAEHAARTALARITREATLAWLISAAQEYRLTFTCTDITGDGADDVVDYTWNPNTLTLTRTLNGASETFAENVTLFSLEYGYETEEVVTIASAGDALAMILGRFNGVDIGDTYAADDVEDEEFDVRDWYYVRQYFDNAVEVPAATSATLRVRTKIVPPQTDLLIWMEDSSEAVAYGYLNRSLLTTTFQDITVPLTWTGGSESKMEADKSYRVYVLAADYESYAGTILYQRIYDGPGLGDGLMFGTSSSWYGNRASMYFTVRGDLPVTTPRRSTVSEPVLKKINVTIHVTEGDQQAELSGACKVINQ